MARRRSRTLHKADTRPAAQSEAVFTPEQAVAIAQALAGKAPITGQVTALPRNPALPAIPFSPGTPLTPSAINAPRPDSGRPEPRAYQFPITANLPGSNEKLVSWDVLRRAGDGVSVFRKCIEIRKDEFSSLEWDIVVSKKAVMRELRSSGATPRAELEQQMQARLAPEIGRLSAFWEEPDRRNGHSWIEWIKKALEERLVLDALAIYPRHTYGGDLYALEVLDGSTIKPLLDELGGRPMPPSAAYQQILWGFPRGEFIADLGEDGLPNGTYPADQLIYEVDNVRAWTPYGYGAVERALVDGALYVQRNAWQMAEYTDGTMPSGWLIAGEGQANWSPDQFAEYERVLNDYYGGITAARQRLRVLPYGMTPHDSPNQAEKYKPDLDLYLLKLCCGHFATTIAELGFTETGGLGSTGWHEGQADVQDRKATRPTVAAMQALVNKLSRRHLHMPPELELKFAGDETDDEQVADTMGSLQYKDARKTLNEERDRLGLARYPYPEADKPFIVGPTGLVFIEGALEQQRAAQEQAAAIADAKANPAAPGEDGGAGGTAGDGPGKPDGPPDGGGEEGLNKVDDPDLVKAELAAYDRWSRRNPNPKRPFRAVYATPADFTDPDPTRVEFDGWVFIADGVVLDKADFVAWNAANPTHPRGPNGKFVKVGSEMHEAALRIARELEPADVREPEPAYVAPPGEIAMRERQARMDRARAMAEAVADVEEGHFNSEGTEGPAMARRVRGMANRHAAHAKITETSELATVLEMHNGDAGAMLDSARRWAVEHHLERGSAPGTVEPYDPTVHALPSWLKDDIRPGDPIEIVKPGYVFTDPVSGDRVQISRAAIEEPSEAAPAAPVVNAEQARQRPTPAGTPAVDDITPAELASARRDLEHDDDLEQRAQGALDEDYVPSAARKFTAAEVRARVMSDRRTAAAGVPGVVLSPEEQALRRGRRVNAGNALRARRKKDPGFLAGNPEAESILDEPPLSLDEMGLGGPRKPGGNMQAHYDAPAPTREEEEARFLRERLAFVDGQIEDAESEGDTAEMARLRGIRERRAAEGVVVDSVPAIVGRTPAVRPRRRNADQDVPKTPEEVQARRDRRAAIDEASIAATGYTPAQLEILGDLKGRRADAEFERATAPKPESRDSSAELVRGVLDGMGSREEAAAYLDGLGLKAPDLRQLAADLGVTVRSGETKPRTRDAIVMLVQRRLDSDAILGTPRAHDVMTPADRQRSAPAMSVEQAQAELAEARQAAEQGRGRRKTRTTMADAARERVVREKEEQLHHVKARSEGAATSTPTGPPRGSAEELAAAVQRWSENIPGADQGAYAEQVRREAVEKFGPDRGAWPEEAHRIVLQAETGAEVRRQHEATGRAANAADAARNAAPSTSEKRAALRAERMAARAKAPAPAAAPVKTGAERQIETQTEHYQQLLARAEDLDTQINFAESDAERRRLEDDREALDRQMQALDRQIAAARKRKGLRKADAPDPKVPPPDQRWPAWTVDQQIAQAYTATILAALSAGLTTTAATTLATRWLDAAATGVRDARAWLKRQGLRLTERLTRPLSNLYTEAIAAGTRSAQAVAEHPAPRLAVSITADWGAWTPGDPEAARLVLSADGLDVRLQRLLDQFGITIKSIADRRFDELAAVLADGLETGKGPDEIAQALTALTGDRAKAYQIAVTETARALSAASVAEYEDAGIATKGWLNADDQDVCPICRENEDAGDIPLDEPFPSGEPFPPAHPGCRCAVIPGVEA